MRVAEVYLSLQGEGRLTGTESVFVRASGCNLRCAYCDTPHASWRPEGDDLSIDELLGRIARFSCRHVVLTGGEPMLFSELIPLSQRLDALGYHITIETAGTLYLPVVCHLMSLSPKLSNSTPDAVRWPRWAERHDRTRHAPEVIRRLLAEYECQVKFVVATPDDCTEVEDYLTQFSQLDPSCVMLMPEGQDLERLRAIEQWLVPYCRNRGWQFCPRKQIEWFGLVRGT